MKRQAESGSKWTIWDLHVHTPESLVNVHYGFDQYDPWEAFVRDLESLPSEYKVIGVNDYIFIDGYKKLKEYKQSGRLENIDLFLPVVELRLDQFAASNGSWKRVNFHVIFSDSISADEIQYQFINGLMTEFQISDIYSHLSSSWSAAPTRDAIEDLGRMIIESVPQQEYKKFNSPLIEGFNNLVFSRDLVERLLSKHIFSGCTLTAIGKAEWESLRWNDHSIATKRRLINSADCVFVASEDVMAANTAQEKLTEQCVNNRLLDCSDAHYHSWHGDKDRVGNCVTWIRAKPTFEGLRQALYEYETRVRLSSMRPNEPVQRLEHIEAYIPSRVQLEGEPFCLSGELAIGFNPCFTCVIGGRGSGKSTLLRMLAKSYGVSVESMAIKDTLSDLTIDGASYDPMEAVSVRGTAASAEVEYIHQNAVEGFAQDASRLRGAIDNRVKKRVIAEKYAELVRALDESHSDILDRSKELQEAASVLDQKARASTELKEKKALIEAVSDASYQAEKERLEKAQRKKRRLVSTLEKVDAVISDLRKAAGALREVADWQDVPYATKASDSGGVIDQVVGALSDRAIRAEAERALAQCNAEEESAQAAIRALFKEKGLDPESVTDVEAATAQVGPLEERVWALDSQLTGLTARAVGEEHAPPAAKQLEEYLDGVIEEMEGDLTSTSDQVEDLAVKAGRNRESARDDWAEWLIGEIRENDPKRRVQEAKIKEILERLPLTDDLNRENLEQCLDEASAEQAARQIRSATEETFDFRIAQLEWLRRQTDIEKYRTYRLVYSGRDIENLSFGQRCTAVLIFLLQMGSAPVIIDEPEAHLDSLLIARYLVQMIKSRKDKRQMIFATHNANFVINGDADLIHHLSINDDGRTEVRSFAIEDLEGREKLLGLEGGHDAFRARAARYQSE